MEKRTGTDSEKVIFIFSSPRSGSTWLGKIFDASPDVFYLHEPDQIDRGVDLLPYWFESRLDPQLLPNARLYLQRLLSIRAAHATGTHPFFKKSFRSCAAGIWRRGLIYADKGIGHIGFHRMADRMPIPNLNSPGYRFVPVIKSVGALGRAAMLIEAGRPNLHPVLLVRHPCACIASIRQARRLRFFETPSNFGKLLETKAAMDHEVTESMINQADEIEKQAWHWLLANSEAFRSVTAIEGMVINFDEFVVDAGKQIKDIFAWCALEWHNDVDEFIDYSHRHSRGYYSVFRYPDRALNAWRRELSAPEISTIRDIVVRDPVGRMFFS